MARRSLGSDGEASAPAFPSRLERFDRVGSTQSIVRDWLLAGSPEVCVAVADVQAGGRGRLGRTWQAPPGRALLLSAGFRPRDLAARHAWRLPAIASLAMLEAAAELLGPGADRLALKWPNDIVAIRLGRPLKLAGVLTETVLDDEEVTQAIVGIGVNVDWPREEFPAALAAGMSSLSEAAGGRRVDRDALLRGWLDRLARGYAALADGRFDRDGWAGTQVTTGARVRVETGDAAIEGVAAGVDGESGDLLVRSGSAGALARVASGDVVRCHIGAPAAQE